MAQMFKIIHIVMVLSVSVITQMHGAGPEMFQSTYHRCSVAMSEKFPRFFRKPEITVESVINEKTGKQDLQIHADKEGLLWAGVAGLSAFAMNECTLRGRLSNLKDVVCKGLPQLNPTLPTTELNNVIITNYNRLLKKQARFSVFRRTLAWRASCLTVPAVLAYNYITFQAEQKKSILAEQETQAGVVAPQDEVTKTVTVVGEKIDVNLI